MWYQLEGTGFAGYRGKAYDWYQLEEKALTLQAVGIKISIFPASLRLSNANGLPRRIRTAPTPIPDAAHSIKRIYFSGKAKTYSEVITCFNLSNACCAALLR